MRRALFFRRHFFPSFLFLAIVAALCAGVSLSGAVAQEQQPAAASGRLESLKVTGSAKFTSEQIAPATGLQVGQQVTREELQGGATSLAYLGPFTNVRYRFFSGMNGVQVEYQVTDAPTVPVFFDDFPWFTDAQMIAYIKTSVPLFDGTPPQHGKILDDIASALAREMQAQGITANVSHELLTLNWNQRQVMLFRAEGDALPTIERVDFSDALANTDPAIRDRIGDLLGKPYSRTAIRSFEFEQVRPVYLAHAFLNLKFGEPTAHLEGNKVVVSAPIDPGLAYKWGGATWQGDDAIPTTNLDKLVALVPGESANGMKILATWEAVRAAFEKVGYLDVKLDPVPHFDDAARNATYTVQIAEGPQYHMGKLVLSGLSMEGERRLRAAWKIAPGVAFDDSAYQEFLESGIKDAFAGLPIHYHTIQKFLDKHPDKGEINVMLNFE